MSVFSEHPVVRRTANAFQSFAYGFQQECKEHPWAMSLALGQAVILLSMAGLHANKMLTRNEPNDTFIPPLVERSTPNYYNEGDRGTQNLPHQNEKQKNASGDAGLSNATLPLLTTHYSRKD